MSYKIARYGWLPDLPDQHDHFYAAPVELAGVLPARVDFRQQCPPVYESFEGAQVARTGRASLPQSGERAIGGVGYDDARHLTDDNLASDFWTIRVVQ